jgi:hypothetical protein
VHDHNADIGRSLSFEQDADDIAPQDAQLNLLTVALIEKFLNESVSKT